MPDTDDAVRFLAEQIERVPLDSIHPHPDNPNEGDVGAIVESISENDFYETILVQRSTGRILSGEHRWRALGAMNADVAPVVYLDVDDEHALRILIGANEIPRRLSRTNDTVLAELLIRLSEDTTAGLLGTGFDGGDLDDLLNDLARDAANTPDGDAGRVHQPPTGIAFRFGDYSGWCSDNVYESFRAAYEQHRTDESAVLLDDVLAAWLGV